MSSEPIAASISSSTGSQSEQPNANIIGVARVLLNGGVITESKALEITKKASADGISFVQALGRDSKVASKKAAMELAKCFDLPYVDLDSIDSEAFPPEKLFERKKIEELRVIPLYIRGQKIFLATSDPTLSDGHEYFTHKSPGKRKELVVVDDNQISAYFGGANSGVELEDASMDLTDYDENQIAESEDTAVEDSEDSPIVKLVNGILLTAFKKGASDIHFEPYEKFYRVRFRIDGALQEINKPPLSMAKKITSRIKVISKLNIAEKRVPQDGKMRFRISPTKYFDLRVSTLPVVGDYEKIVMRILDPSQSQMGIESLGYEPEQKTALMEAIHRPEGMVLVTGPTGSGKTVSLYTCLNILNTMDKNISTAEDPAEIQLPGINQVNVNPAQGLTFAHALKAFLRQDPDIIMVGEIRDEETAGISVKAATTGHLVLATLHTNSAPKTISRLVEIGVKPYEIASSVNLITAQRLLRRLCKHCKVKHIIQAEVLLENGLPKSDVAGLNKEWTPYSANAEGCEHCNKGYKGRVGIYEVMPISDDMRKLISKNADSMALEQQAQLEGIKNLRQSGLVKYMQGLTSLEEVMSNT